MLFRRSHTAEPTKGEDSLANDTITVPHDENRRRNGTMNTSQVNHKEMIPRMMIE